MKSLKFAIYMSCKAIVLTTVQLYQHSSKYSMSKPMPSMQFPNLQITHILQHIIQFGRIILISNTSKHLNSYTASPKPTRDSNVTIVCPINSNIISSSILASTKVEFGRQLAINLTMHGLDGISITIVYLVAIDHQQLEYNYLLQYSNIDRQP